MVDVELQLSFLSYDIKLPRWWRHQMETFSALLAFCAGNSPVSGELKCQWRGALKVYLICAWINDWINNREAGDLRRHCAFYEVIVILCLWSIVEMKATAVHFAPTSRVSTSFPVGFKIRGGASYEKTEHIEAEAKCPPFPKHFQIDFLERTCLHFKISLKFVPRCLINKWFRWWLDADQATSH